MGAFLDLNWSTALFGNGWWSVGVWLAAVLGFVIPYVLAGFVGRGITRDLIRLCLFLGAPFGAMFLFVILDRFANPDPACTYDCWSSLDFFFITIVAFVMWVLGASLGCLHRFLRDRTIEARVSNG